MEKELLIRHLSQVTDEDSLLKLLNVIKVEMLGTNAYPFDKCQMQIFRKDGGDCNYTYSIFSLPKKSAGFREIHSPRGNLKCMQLCLNEILKTLYTPCANAMGFTAGKSIVDNAKVHLNKEYVFNIDLFRFFSYVNDNMIICRLMQEPFCFNRLVSRTIADLCTIKGYITDPEAPNIHWTKMLPEGAPTSPILTNAVCDNLDKRLNGLAKDFGLTYTRYADDITFSSNYSVYQPDGRFQSILRQIIETEGFFINEKKTRLCHRSQRQEVTGLTVNEKPNITRKWVKDIRAVLHIWEKYGYNAAMTSMFPHYASDRDTEYTGVPSMESIIDGKLCFLKMVKGENDPMFLRLRSQFDRINKSPAPCYTYNGIWSYIMSMPVNKFEKWLGVKLELRYSESRERFYACFFYHNTFFYVAIGKRVNNIYDPNEAEISLCLISDRTDLRGIKKTSSWLLFIHRRHDRHFPKDESDECRTMEEAAQYQLKKLHRDAPLQSEPKPKPKPIDYETLPDNLKAIVDRLREFLPDIEITEICEGWHDAE